MSATSSRSTERQGEYVPIDVSTKSPEICAWPPSHCITQSCTASRRSRLTSTPYCGIGTALLAGTLSTSSWPPELLLLPPPVLAATASAAEDFRPPLYAMATRGSKFT